MSITQIREPRLHILVKGQGISRQARAVSVRALAIGSQHRATTQEITNMQSLHERISEHIRLEEDNHLAFRGPTCLSRISLLDKFSRIKVAATPPDTMKRMKRGMATQLGPMLAIHRCSLGLPRGIRTLAVEDRKSVV